tara:strand:- start:2068 stop:2370 length:303 start_codon:yes stop_codon:yes gene_type:complete
MAKLTEEQVALLKEAEPTAKGTARYYWKTTNGKSVISTLANGEKKDYIPVYNEVEQVTEIKPELEDLPKIESNPEPFGKTTANTFNKTGGEETGPGGRAR